MSQSIGSNRTRKQKKPPKPYPEFPLFPHATKRWAKKIRGRMHYFGPWDDPQAALKKYLEQRDDLHAGRSPRVQGEGFAVRDLCNKFLTSKRHLLDTREITPRTFQDNYQTCAVLVEAFGRTRLVADLAADDFERETRPRLATTRFPRCQSTSARVDRNRRGQRERAELQGPKAFVCRAGMPPWHPR